MNMWQDIQDLWLNLELSLSVMCTVVLKITKQLPLKRITANTPHLNLSDNVNNSGE